MLKSKSDDNWSEIVTNLRCENEFCYSAPGEVKRNSEKKRSEESLLGSIIIA